MWVERSGMRRDWTENPTNALFSSYVGCFDYKTVKVRIYCFPSIDGYQIRIKIYWQSTQYVLLLLGQNRL